MNELVVQKTLTIAVAGNPNSGKSTLINAIAGSKLHVGNWPGVTVEKKEANITFEDTELRFIDLPGTYSLSPYSQEEIIARDFLINEKPDVILNVVDSTNLERNLYLTFQLLELRIPVIVAFNMFDEFNETGYKINLEKFEKLLDIIVIPTIATTKSSLDILLKELHKLASKSDIKVPAIRYYAPELEASIEAVINHLDSSDDRTKIEMNPRWFAMKLLEGDSDVLTKHGLSDHTEVVEEIQSKLLEEFEGDFESLLGESRYGLISGIVKETLSKPKTDKKALTEKIDRIVLNRYLGIPVFLLTMWLMFKLTFDIANPFVDWIDNLTSGIINHWASSLLYSLSAPDWFTSLITDGIIAGVGFVMVFIPVIFAMMFFITLLEGSGYMARAAFVMDKAMHGIGLHGKSFIPLLLGFGCNVPAVYATRTLENERDRILTSLLVPFMSCGARLPVYVVFIAVFFKEDAGLVLWLLYVLGLVIAVLSGLFFKKTIFKSESPLFIMELPPYRMPSFRSLMIHTWEKGKHFVIKAGTYILAVSILVWFSLNLPWGVEKKQDSILGIAGQIVAPVLAPIGFGNWEAASSLLTGIIAKEIVVGTMAEIYVHDLDDEQVHESTFVDDVVEIGRCFIGSAVQAGSNIFSTFGMATMSTAEDPGQANLQNVIKGKFTPLAAFSFMVFVLLYMPCIITGVAYKQEFGTWKWYGISIINGFVVAWLLSFLVFQIGSLLSVGV